MSRIYSISILLFLSFGTLGWAQTIVYADHQPGATADIKLNACIQAAINRTAHGRIGGGVCDARDLYGRQVIASQVNVGDSQQDQVTLLLPTFATWVVTINDTNQCGLKQYGNSAIIGTDSGGSNQMLIEPAGIPGQTINSLYCTDSTPLGGGSYVRAEGFELYNPFGTAMTAAAMVVQFTFDNSTFKDITIADYGNIGLFVYGSCCGTSFWNITSSSNYGLSAHGTTTAAIPIEIRNNHIEGGGHGNGAISFYSLSADHPSPGQPCVLILGSPNPYYLGDSLQFHNLYMEGSNTDTSTPMVQVNAPLTVAFWGVTVNRGVEGSKAYAFDVNSSFRSQFQVFGFSFVNDAAGTAYGPVVNDHINGIQAMADRAGNLSFYSTTVFPSVRQSLVTGSAAYQVLRILGVTPTSRCSISATNALGAAYIAGTYILSKRLDELIVAHLPLAGMGYDVVCTAY